MQDFFRNWSDLWDIFNYSAGNMSPILLEKTSDFDRSSTAWADMCKRDFSGLVSEIGNDIFAVPLFTCSYCDRLTSFVDAVASFTIDSDNDAFAAPEFKVRDLSPLIERSVRHVIVQHIAPIMYQKWCVVPSIIHDPFIIKYSSSTKNKMERHHDMHSDVTISVNLNNTFEGGGLHFVRQNITTSGLPVGTAVIFPGRVTHMHEALPIHSGRRLVLTIWTEHRD